MIFLLSSGSRPRYLDDIIRAMALPDGATLTFRYERKYLSNDVLQLFTNGNPNGRVGVVCYIDQSQQGVTPQVVPCRLVTINAWEDLGRSVSLDLKVGGFPLIADLQAFNSDLRQGTSDFPAWSEGKLTGAWCFESKNPAFATASWSNENAWHDIVDQLANFSEFGAKDAFLRYLGIRTPSAATHPGITTHSNWHSLDPQTEYILEVYHYHPKKVADAKRLTVSVSDDKLVKIVSVPSKPLDSRYGLLRYRLITAAPVSLEKTALILSFGSDDSPEIEYDAVISVAPSWARVAFRILSIGFFVAAPSIVAANLADKLTWNAGLLMLVLGLGAGVASTLILPRSV